MRLVAGILVANLFVFLFLEGLARVAYTFTAITWNRQST
jgi:hypothetical protein